MDQAVSKSSNDVVFCETCRHRIKTFDGVEKCGFTEKSLRFYDRACMNYEPTMSYHEFTWDSSRNAFVIR